MPEGPYLTVPNAITAARLPLAAGVGLFHGELISYVLFALFVLSDGLDGWVARGMDQISEFGAMLDPAVDKLAALLLFALLFPSMELPLVYVALFFMRDIAVVLGVGLSPFIGLPSDALSPRLAGKAVTNLQFVSVLALLVPSRPVFVVLAWLLGAVSSVAIADYAFVVAEAAFGKEVSRVHRVGGYGAAMLAFVYVVVLVLDDYLASALGMVLVSGL